MKHGADAEIDGAFLEILEASAAIPGAAKIIHGAFKTIRSASTTIHTAVKSINGIDAEIQQRLIMKQQGLRSFHRAK